MCWMAVSGSWASGLPIKKPIIKGPSAASGRPVVGWHKDGCTHRLALRHWVPWRWHGLGCARTQVRDPRCCCRAMPVQHALAGAGQRPSPLVARGGTRGKRPHDPLESTLETWGLPPGQLREVPLPVAPARDQAWALPVGPLQMLARALPHPGPASHPCDRSYSGDGGFLLLSPVFLPPTLPPAGFPSPDSTLARRPTCLHWCPHVRSWAQTPAPPPRVPHPPASGWNKRPSRCSALAPSLRPPPPTPAPSALGPFRLSPALSATLSQPHPAAAPLTQPPGVLRWITALLRSEASTAPSFPGARAYVLPVARARVMCHPSWPALLSAVAALQHAPLSSSGSWPRRCSPPAVLSPRRPPPPPALPYRLLSGCTSLPSQPIAPPRSVGLSLRTAASERQCAVLVATPAPEQAWPESTGSKCLTNG